MLLAWVRKGVPDLNHGEAKFGHHLLERNALAVLEPILGARYRLFFLFAYLFVLHRRRCQCAIHRIEKQKLQETYGSGQLIGRDTLYECVGVLLIGFHHAD